MPITLDLSNIKDFITEQDLQANMVKAALASKELCTKECKGADYTGWRTLPFDYDKDEFERIKAAALRIRRTSQVLIVIGIGGSYLGARAAIEFLGSRFYNDFSPLKIYFAGNSICPQELSYVLELCKGKDVCINVISKSGTTTEPAVAFRIFKTYMEQRYGKEEAAKRIFATTDKSCGTLKQLADKEGYETFVVPDNIGGRYSVLTAVGLLPIAAAGFDIDKLMQGAQAGAQAFDNMNSNICNKYAAVRNALYNNGKNTEIFACFDPAFAMFNEWLKQLFGESEGKDGKGIFPASVIFSTDLHSLGQYIQDGKRMLFETVIEFNAARDDITLLSEPEDFDSLNYLAGKTLDEINKTAQAATIMAHKDGGVPCIIIKAAAMDEFNLGELIYFFERACAVSGAVLGVNPFDQPGVESYKKNMFRLLKKPGYTD